MPLLVLGPSLKTPMELTEPSSRVRTSKPLYFFFHCSGYGGQPSTGGGTSALNRPVSRASAFDMPARTGPTAPGTTTSFAGPGAGSVAVGVVGSAGTLGSGDGAAVVSFGVGGSSDPQPPRTRRVATSATNIRFTARSSRTGEALGVGTGR